MNKFIKHLLCLGVLSSTGLAIANDSNPNSAGYHARHNASSAYYIGPKGAANQQQAAPQPTGYWVKTWGAIAPSGLDAVLGTAVGADSKKEAERLALAECKAKGGENCKVQLAYHNQCGVMTIGTKRLFTASAGTVEEAKEFGLALCQKKDTNCSVYYSACTEPRFVKY
ncbi:DUF4189 domain-containing protein [Acinetobacter courvalinii]|uniref:DUF4189 domain-containing protein n=1 Tax=Acinetobacter courvalinii TaxID=280147 RepID=UPI0021CFEB16|nr:DUF4189 domain-containing protein [Acinetobacter courvalinii]MCU4576462.1 DUF4189 domain-containing protein [Acinetobacter courvalinii]